jgi:hypothetical protein
VSLVVPWLVFPLVLGILSLGCGFLVECAAGVELPSALLLPVGFAAIVIVTLFTTSNDVTARLTTPLVIALTVAGLALSLPWRTRRFDRWALVSAGGVYVAFGLPVLGSGMATFAGYTKLDDTSSWLGITDRLMEHGRDLAGLAPSTYQAMLDYYLHAYGYPVGPFLPLGVGHSLVGTDSAWLFQPYLSFLAALLALGLYGLVRRVVESPRFRALTAVIAAQAALLYGYALWGGVKEIATAAMFVLVVALTPSVLQDAASQRSLLPLAAATAALFGVLNLGSAVWLAPVLVAVLALGICIHRRAFLRIAAAFVAVAIVLSVPSLMTAGRFAKDLSLNSKGGDPGNLIHRLSWLQLFGIWPVGDFRLRPGDMPATYILIAVVISAAAVGIAWAVQRRLWELPVYVGATVVGCLITAVRGSIWVDAKALAIASPAFLLAGMTGVVWIIRSGRRTEAAVVATAIAGGVLWSNALAYHDVWLAPRSQLRELELIGKRFARQGPALITESQSYGVRHFLREMDPEAPSELRRRVIPLRNGQQLPKGGYADLDRFQLEAIMVYRTLVLPHSPSASRPPSVYRLAWSGRFYDVWQRVADTQRILVHVPLGRGDQAVAIPRCGVVLGLAHLAATDGGLVAAVVRPAATIVRPSTASLPPTWQTLSSSADVVYPSSSGTLKATVVLSRSGRYGIWLRGSFRRSLEVRLDGRRIYSGRDQLIHEGIETLLGYAPMRAGRHLLVLRYSAANIRPGSGGAPFPLGPIVVSRFTDEVPVTFVEPSDARSLCGKTLDWVEAVGS